MTNKDTRQICPMCGEKNALWRTKWVQYKYMNDIITHQQFGLWCDSCKDGVIEDLKILDENELLEDMTPESAHADIITGEKYE